MVKMSDVKYIKKRIRERIWKLMEERNIAKFPRPVFGRIPNFVGSEEAALKLINLKLFKLSEVIKVNPDSPQQYVRYLALKYGKKVVMPTPKLREGFLLLDPKKIKVTLLREASTIKGAFKWGIKIKPWSLPSIDLMIVGSVAVDKFCARLGKGGGYAELEYGILREVDAIDNKTPVITTIHDVQLINERIPVEPHDLPVDYVITPTRIIKCEKVYEKPKGILWDLLPNEKLNKIPILQELKLRLNNLK